MHLLRWSSTGLVIIKLQSPSLPPLVLSYQPANSLHPILHSLFLILRIDIYPNQLLERDQLKKETKVLLAFGCWSCFHKKVKGMNSGVFWRRIGNIPLAHNIQSAQMMWTKWIRTLRHKFSWPSWNYVAEFTNASFEGNIRAWRPFFDPEIDLQWKIFQRLIIFFYSALFSRDLNIWVMTLFKMHRRTNISHKKIKFSLSKQFKDLFSATFSFKLDVCICVYM